MPERCGAYREHYEELGRSKDWLGCSLPRGHEGAHSDKEGEVEDDAREERRRS